MVDGGGRAGGALFHVPSANDGRPVTVEYACGIEVMCRAASRAEAASVIRGVDVTSFSARDVVRVRPADEQAVEPPPVGDGEVWVRTTAVPGAWERRR